jgi:hypothetical protein
VTSPATDEACVVPVTTLKFVAFGGVGGMTASAVKGRL